MFLWEVYTNNTLLPRLQIRLLCSQSLMAWQCRRLKWLWEHLANASTWMWAWSMASTILSQYGRTFTFTPSLYIVVIFICHFSVVQATEGSEGSTFCNRPWSEFFERTKIQPSELWPTMVRWSLTRVLFITPCRGRWSNVSSSLCHCLQPHTLLTAKLYVASHTDPEANAEDIFWLATGSPSEETLLRLVSLRGIMHLHLCFHGSV